MKTPSNILIMMSGSIACAKATQLISSWRKAGHSVRVAAMHEDELRWAFSLLLLSLRLVNSRQVPDERLPIVAC